MPDNERSRYTIHSDRWDREDYEKIRREVNALALAADSLAEITTTARPEIADIFNIFYKSRRKLKDLDEVRDDHRVNYAVNEQALELPDIKELLHFTSNDLVGAAMAAVKVEPVLEELFDRNKQLQKAADKLQQLRDELQDKLQDLVDNMAKQAQQSQDQEGEGGEGQEGEGEGEGEGQGGGGQGLKEQEKSLRDQIEALENAIAKMSEDLEKDIESQAPSMRASVRSAVRKATDEARAEAEAAQAWGIDPGDLLRMDAKERLALARLWNTKDLREIAKRFGAYRNLTFTSKWIRVDDVPQEVVGVTLGRDVERLIPEELVRLRHPILRRQFLQDFAEGRLRQFKMVGKEKVGRGGIVLCEDGSASMRGTRELEAKAIMLCLLNIAKTENREFHLVHFGSPGQFKTFSFMKPADFTPARIIEAAEFFANGGTDFQTPLDEAMRILKKEHAHSGKVDSDIIHLSDGECGVKAEWLTEFHADLDRLQGTIWGIDVSGSDHSFGGNVMSEICRGQVCTVEDLSPTGTNNGRDFKKIFAGVQRKKK